MRDGTVLHTLHPPQWCCRVLSISCMALDRQGTARKRGNDADADLCRLVLNAAGLK